jgi:heat shock protein HslJ
LRNAFLVIACLTAPLLASGAVCASMRSLEGTQWHVVKIQGVDVPAGLTLSFEADRVTGSTGCNRFWAPVTYLDPPAIDIGAPQSKRIFCAGVMSIERAYLASLESVESFVIDGDILKMKMSDGDVFVHLKAAP